MCEQLGMLIVDGIKHVYFCSIFLFFNVYVYCQGRLGLLDWSSEVKFQVFDYVRYFCSVISTSFIFVCVCVSSIFYLGGIIKGLVELNTRLNRNQSISIQYKLLLHLSELEYLIILYSSAMLDLTFQTYQIILALTLSEFIFVNC